MNGISRNVSVHNRFRIFLQAAWTNYHSRVARHVLWNILASFSFFLAEDQFCFRCNLLCLHVLWTHYLRATNSGLPPYRNYGARVANVRLRSLVPQMTVGWSFTISSGWRVEPAAAVWLHPCSSAIKYGSEGEVEGVLLFVGGFCDFCEWNVCS